MLMVKYLADTDKNPAFRVTEMSSEDFLLVLVIFFSSVKHVGYLLLNILLAKCF